MNYKDEKFGEYFIKRFHNYRQRDPKDCIQDMNNLGYEGYMRGDFSTPKSPKMTHIWDGIEILRIDNKENK